MFGGSIVLGVVEFKENGLIRYIGFSGRILRKYWLLFPLPEFVVSFDVSNLVVTDGVILFVVVEVRSLEAFGKALIFSR